MPALRLIPGYGLRTYFAIIFLIFCAALSAITYGALSYTQQNARDQLIDAIEAADLQAVAAMERETRETLVQITADVLMLRGLFTYYLTQAEGRQNLDQIAHEFMQRQRSYDQLRFLSVTGEEIIRLDNTPAGPELRPDEELQNKRSTRYFQNALALESDQILISQLELNRERGEIERPFKPVIRLLTPVEIAGERRGFVVLNFLARRFLSQMQGIGDAAIGSPAVVGVPGVDALATFGDATAVELPTGPSFAERYPEPWSTIRPERAGVTDDGAGGLFVFSRYFPGMDAIPHRVGESVSWTLPMADDPTRQGGLYLISHIDAADIQRITDLRIGMSKAVVTLFAMIILCLSWLVSARFANLRGHSQSMLTLATRDALTGIPNRGEFDARLKQALAHARRHDRAMALLYVDLDNFKEINDDLGHSVGDEVLQGVAKTLVSTVRSSDFVGRIGGDEFAVVLTEIRGRQDAQGVAEKLREHLNTAMQLSDRIIQVGASVGCATFPADASDPTALYEAADRAMYQQKSKRRKDRRSSATRTA